MNTRKAASKHVKYHVATELCGGEVDRLNSNDIPHTFDIRGSKTHFKAHYADNETAKKLHTHLKQRIDEGNIDQGDIEGLDDLLSMAKGDELVN